MRIFFLLFASLAIFSCKPESSKGYDDVEELYKESIKALQTKDSTAIRNFIEKAFPDDGTADYMYAHDYHYRGFPESLKDRPRLLDTMRTVYTRRFYRFALELEERNILTNLKFAGFDEKLVIDTMPGKKDLLFTEPFGKCVSGNDTIEFKIGELMKVNGKWKSFTDPKL